MPIAALKLRVKWLWLSKSQAMATCSSGSCAAIIAQARWGDTLQLARKLRCR